jgi:hypothetical protein
VVAEEERRARMQKELDIEVGLIVDDYAEGEVVEEDDENGDREELRVDTLNRIEAELKEMEEQDSSRRLLA